MGFRINAQNKFGLMILKRFAQLDKHQVCDFLKALI